MLAKASRSVAAVGHRPMVNLLEQLPRWYTLVVALTPFRGTIVVALVGATVIQEGYIKREVCSSAKSGTATAFHMGQAALRQLLGPLDYYRLGTGRAPKFGTCSHIAPCQRPAGRFRISG